MFTYDRHICANVTIEHTEKRTTTMPTNYSLDQHDDDFRLVKEQLKIPTKTPSLPTHPNPAVSAPLP